MDERDGDLSAAARSALKALRREFRRCSNWYPPLYHEKLLPWSIEGTVPISDEQWIAFQSANENVLAPEPDDWSDWSGLHDSYQGSDSPFLGRWVGSPDGVDEFINLSNSVCMAFADEDLGENPSIRSCGDWLWLLHKWSFRHQMPLLQSDMNVWGCDEYPTNDDFYRLIEIWSDADDDGVRIPKHPLVWRLTYNVFTSSIAAIDAFLRPENVIVSNEPFEDWPCRTVETAASSSNIRSDIQLTSESGDIGKNRFVFTGVIWEIAFEHEPERGTQQFKPSKDFHRWAMLLANPWKPFDPYDFFQEDLREGMHRHVDHDENDPSGDRTDLGDDNGTLDEDSGLTSDKHVEHQLRMDKQYERIMRNRLQELRVAKEQAIAKDNLPIIEKIEAEAYNIKHQLQVDTNIRGDSRTLDPKGYEVKRKAIANSLTRGREKIYDKLPKLAAHLKSCLNTSNGFRYAPPGDLAPWDVVIKPCQS